jgi:RAB protein geranylgeranyltransferase component A
VDNFNLYFMIKQSYQVIKNINTKLMQLEWIKKELNSSSYEFPKFGTLFLH